MSQKVKKYLHGRQGLNNYKNLVIGQGGLWDLFKYELIIGLSGSVPGALGLWLRKKIFPLLLGKVGQGVVFGRNVTLRHPKKIKIGNNVVIDDGVVLDAKGENNLGITIGNGIYIGRNNIVYCKNGDIEIKDGTTISHNCVLSSTNKLIIGQDCVIASFCYLLSGGRYDLESRVKFVDQTSGSKGPTIIEDNCWLGAGVLVNDGVRMGQGAVVGAGAVVVDDVPDNCLAAGVPAKIIKKLKQTDQ